MNNAALFMLLAACVVHEPTYAAPVTHVDLATLPARTLTVEAAAAELWRTELRPAWRAPTVAEQTTIASLIPALLQGASTGQIGADVVNVAQSIGMLVERWEVAGRAHVVLREAPEQRRGAGAYLFAITPASSVPWLLFQAPHAYYDLYTGTISANLYFTPPVGAAPTAFFTNTLHRYTQADGKRDRRATNPADACHNPDHLFNIATLAAARARAGATVVQLHGFAADTDDEDGLRTPAEAIAVISAGTDTPTPLSTAAAAALRTALGTGVLLYPTDTQVLGATTNVEKRGLATVPNSRFLHVELVTALRERLAKDPSLRDTFGAALFALSTQP